MDSEVLKPPPQETGQPAPDAGDQAKAAQPEAAAAPKTFAEIKAMAVESGTQDKTEAKARRSARIAELRGKARGAWQTAKERSTNVWNKAKEIDSFAVGLSNPDVAAATASLIHEKATGAKDRLSTKFSEIKHGIIDRKDTAMEAARGKMRELRTGAKTKYDTVVTKARTQGSRVEQYFSRQTDRATTAIRRDFATIDASFYGGLAKAGEVVARNRIVEGIRNKSQQSREKAKGKRQRAIDLSERASMLRNNRPKVKPAMA